tara:strand:- start:2388 stop:2828 length:441 start_codon:yes stop_codon:yes gene_type:complete
MAKPKLSPIIKAQREALKKEIKKTLRVATEVAINFFKDSFKQQGFLDRRVKKWKPRKQKSTTNRAILVKSGKLRRSIATKKINASRGRAVIGILGKAGVYAGVHNFGLKAGRGKGFTMPKRQFMGDSHKLNKKIKRLIRKRLNKKF